MNKVLKKVSALFLIILMISSISFNVISYGVDTIREYPWFEITEIFEDNDEILEIDDEILEIDDEILEIDDEILEIDDEILEIDDEILEIDDEILEIDDEILEIDDEILEIDDEILEIDDEILEIDDEILEINDDDDKKSDDKQIIPSNNAYNLMITNKNNNNQAYTSDKIAKNINKGDSSDYNVLLTRDASGQYYYCMEKGGALMLYANGGATLREFYYKATTYNLTSEQKIILAYLNSDKVKTIGGISLNTNNNREKIIQYYIWKSGINEGYSTTVPDVYANIISSLQKCVNGKIKIGNDVLDVNEEILTINGINYEIEEFSAYKYTSKLIYRRDNGKGYIESNYQGCGQEIFSFISKITPEDEDDDTLNLQLQLYKHDQNGNIIPGVEFTVFNYSQELVISKDKLIVQSNGYTNIINIDGIEKGKTYNIELSETAIPNGYKKLDSNIILTITTDLEGNIIWTTSWFEDNKYITRNGNGGAILLDVENKKEEIFDEAKLAYPLLMYIKGTAFLDGVEGKESKLDGYYNPENNSDKGLEGIKVEIYDEATNNLAIFATRETLTLNDNNIIYNTSDVDFNALEKYGKATTYTDKDGNFEFYGLNPSHTYYIVFTYNGMRYVEIKATTETGIDSTNYNIKLANASKAIEIDRKNKITDIFSEIGTYPYNYYSTSKGGYNIAYNQDDVEEAIKNGLSRCGNNYEMLYNNLSQYMDASLAYFIKDCQVTARISGLGNILSEAEKQVREYNASIKQNAGNYMYPVVQIHNVPNINQVAFNKDYGYNVYKWYGDPIVVDGKLIGYTDPYWHNAGTGSVGTLSYDERQNGEWNIVGNQYIMQDAQLMQALRNQIAQSDSYTRYEENITGNWSELKEGYEAKTVNGVQFAVFDVKNQNYLGGWYNRCQSVTYQDEYNKLKENLKTLNEDINRNLICANLGVQYRSTFDMALYNDVQKADVTINGVPGEYVYDKRAANGQAFSFGVNEYDLKTYYRNLSDGNVQALRDLKYNTTINSANEYMNYLRSSDIHYLSTVENTNTGIAQAGGYEDKNNSIYLTYKIHLINQSSVEGTVTEIVDYYNSDFEVAKVYGENNKQYQYSAESIYNSRGIKKNAPNGYSALYIRLDNTNLKNNESQYIYIVLKMKDIPNTLTSEALNNGYKVINLAEINGYKTANGYIDIDSMVGNIVETNRFENGKYEDDESKSPTLIFKNPSEEGRTISGIVFEDATTGEWVINGSRQQTANNQYDEKDILIQGATVQLIQILNDGTEKISAQTSTTNKGEYKFIHVRPGNYVVRFAYGNSDMTALTSKNKIDDEGNALNIQNEKSYNGESFESTEKKVNATLGAEGYWYTDSDIDTNIRYSDAKDDEVRRKEVTENFATLKNENAEILSSYKDTKVNRSLVTRLKTLSYMFATTDTMKLEMEYVGTKNENTNRTTTTANNDGQYKYEYNITNVDFGVVERSRTKLDVIKQVSYISLVDSTGEEITGGTYDDWKAGKIKYIKWILGEDGFVDMEIDTELLSGATLKITYDITVKDNSEAGNEITNIEVVDYVTNNLNYATDYKNNEGKDNSTYGWKTTTTDNLLKNQYVNNTSANSKDEANKIDISTYQTILTATFKPGETKRLTLEKNLSPEEGSDFNYDNKVEIISSTNTKGRGDYYSIYGNLDPETYTSRQGNLYWDFIKGITSSSDNVTESITESHGFNAIRIAEGDSASAEEVIVTPPEGLKAIVIPGEYYIFGITLAVSLLIGTILIKKYRQLA